MILINIIITAVFFNTFIYIHDEYASIVEFSAAHFNAEQFSNPQNLFFNYNSALSYFNFFGILATPLYSLKPVIYNCYPGIINYFLLLVTALFIYEVLQRFFESTYFSYTAVFLILFNPVIHKMARSEEIFIFQVFMISLYILFFHVIFIQQNKSKLFLIFFIITFLLSLTIGPMYVIFNSAFILFLLLNFKSQIKTYFQTEKRSGLIFIGLLVILSVFYYIMNFNSFIMKNSANYGLADKLPTYLKIYLKYLSFLKTDPSLYSSIDWRFYTQTLFLSQIKSNLVYFSKFNPLFLKITFVISITFLIYKRKTAQLVFWIGFLALLTSFYFYWNIPKTIEINLNVIQRAIPELFFFSCLSCFFIIYLPQKCQKIICVLISSLALFSFFSFADFLNQKTGEQQALEFFKNAVLKNSSCCGQKKYIMLIPYSNQYNTTSMVESNERTVFFNYVNQRYRYEHFSRRLGRLIQLYDAQATVEYIDIIKSNPIKAIDEMIKSSGNNNLFLISDMSYYLEGADDIALFNTKPQNIIINPSPLKKVFFNVLKHYATILEVIDTQEIKPYSAYIYRNPPGTVIGIYRLKIQ